MPVPLAAESNIMQCRSGWQWIHTRKCDSFFKISASATVSAVSTTGTGASVPLSVQCLRITGTGTGSAPLPVSLAVPTVPQWAHSQTVTSGSGSSHTSTLLCFPSAESASASCFGLLLAHWNTQTQVIKGNENCLDRQH